MKRIPEEELMLDEEQARAYAEASFHIQHERFVKLFGERFQGDLIGKYVLDLGCGPADITLRFARCYPRCYVHGVDGSKSMLKFGRQAVRRERLEQYVVLIEGLLPTAKLPRDRYDVVISNSVLHHLQDPQMFWSAVSGLAGSNSLVFVMDLLRPESRGQASKLTELHVSEEPKILQRDFYNSLLAAYRTDEIEAQLERAGLGHFSLEVVSDYHLVVWGTMPLD
ncbi:MAG: class I SAM-dependent methyltransferase [Acidobacteriota bacterium]|nr:class I SAM-dependent methyltransferase [Acidobacteriota bacterium]